MKPNPTIAQLNDAFILDRESGVLTWRNDRVGGKGMIIRVGGHEAGSLFKNGYRYVALTGKQMLTHRVIIAMLNGAWPEQEVDHVNGDPKDNRPCNLRLATSAQNKHNRAISNRNTSGELGVSWSKRRRKWCVEITANKHRIRLGHFDDLEFAGLVYASAADRFHGEFVRAA